MDEENLKFSTEEAAHYLDVAPGTLENWRVQRRGPVYYKPSNRIYYIKADLDAWIRKGAVNG